MGGSDYQLARAIFNGQATRTFRIEDYSALISVVERLMSGGCVHLVEETEHQRTYRMIVPAEPSTIASA